ncbi:MAG TPA: rhodanese-like domain-containing protein [Gammaproteobacteria bacterium]|jgi:adenylyltransferase/sulfurtransferase|nr:rhodanese-like domain-containing protein [Gammaproteobacteria bacterium]
MSVPEISVQELEALRNAGADIIILDVRNSDEYAVCNLGGCLIPINELPTRFKELDPDKQIIVHCHAGGRARRATEFLIQQGYKQVFNLRGGITAWANEIDPKMAKY